MNDAIEEIGGIFGGLGRNPGGNIERNIGSAEGFQDIWKLFGRTNGGSGTDIISGLSAVSKRIFGKTWHLSFCLQKIPLRIEHSADVKVCFLGIEQQ